MIGVPIAMFVSWLYPTEIGYIMNRMMVAASSTICCMLGVEKIRENLSSMMREVIGRLNVVQQVRSFWSNFTEDNNVYDISN